MKARSFVAPPLIAIALLGSGCTSKDESTTAAAPAAAPSTPAAPKVDGPAADPPADATVKGAEQEAVAVISLPGMADATDSASARPLIQGTGVIRIDIELDQKKAVVRYDPAKTKAEEILGRLKANKRFAESSIINNRVIAK